MIREHLMSRKRQDILCKMKHDFLRKLFPSLASEDIRVYKNGAVSLIGFYHPCQRRSDQNPLLASIGCEQKILYWIQFSDSCTKTQYVSKCWTHVIRFSRSTSVRIYDIVLRLSMVVSISLIIAIIKRP